MHCRWAKKMKEESDKKNDTKKLGLFVIFPVKRHAFYHIFFFSCSYSLVAIFVHRLATFCRVYGEFLYFKKRFNWFQTDYMHERNKVKTFVRKQITVTHTFIYRYGERKNSALNRGKKLADRNANINRDKYHYADVFFLGYYATRVHTHTHTHP